MSSLCLIAHNIRSAHNVGSLIRTAEGLGSTGLYLTGYSPYPLVSPDERLPHLARKINDRIHKTALGAEKLLPISYMPALDEAIKTLKAAGYKVAALEQSSNSIELSQFKPPSKLALLVGNEVNGLSVKELELCDYIVEIPMKGKKESFNVAAAAAMALYQLAVN